MAARFGHFGHSCYGSASDFEFRASRFFTRCPFTTKRTVQTSRPIWGRGSGFGDRLPLETETAVFILVNVLDVFLTVLLLMYRGGRETNPIAGFFLDGWGLRGLVYFKFAMVAVTCLIAQVIARHRLPTARRLLYGVTAIVGAVVVYSLFLLGRGG